MLDLRAPPNSTGGPPASPHRDTAAYADQDATQRFQNALAGPPRDTEPPGGGQQGAPASPFDLMLGRLAAVPLPDRAGDPDRLVDAVCDLVDRILVGDGSAGRREVCLALADDLLPGVTVRVYESEGAWIADFEATDPHSFQQLAEPADEMARNLAKLLHRDAVWQVADRADPSRAVRARSAPGSEPAR